MTRWTDEERWAVGLGGLLRRSGSDLLSEAQPLPRWEGVLLTGAQSVPPPPSRSRRALPVLMAVAAVLPLLLWLTYRAPAVPALSYEVHGAEVNGARVDAGDDEGAQLRFTDGSSWKLSARSEVIVHERTERGAELELAHGNVLASVRHLPNASWRLNAGPYVIRVIGTEFATSWEPARGDFGLALHKGAVSIHGPGLAADGLQVAEGQRFSANAQRGAWRLETVADAPSADAFGAKTAAGMPNVPGDPMGPLPSALPGPQPSAMEGGAAEARRPAKSWAKLVSNGEFERVFSLAQQRGLDGCASECSDLEIRALADAARYTGRNEIARRFLQVARSRGGAPGVDATFFLAGVAEVQGRATEALEHWSAYLAMAPSGRFASEARSRRMAVLQRLGRREEAKQAAREYLALHPSGVSAEAARVLLQNP